MSRTREKTEGQAEDLYSILTLSRIHVLNARFQLELTQLMAELKEEEKGVITSYIHFLQEIAILPVSSDNSVKQILAIVKAYDYPEFIQKSISAFNREKDDPLLLEELCKLYAPPAIQKILEQYSSFWKLTKAPYLQRDIMEAKQLVQAYIKANYPKFPHKPITGDKFIDFIEWAGEGSLVGWKQILGYASKHLDSRFTKWQLFSFQEAVQLSDEKLGEFLKLYLDDYYTSSVSNKLSEVFKAKDNHLIKKVLQGEILYFDDVKNYSHEHPEDKRVTKMLDQIEKMVGLNKTHVVEKKRS